MAVRILRLIEYIYKDEERAAADQLRWTHSRSDRTMMMKSAVMPFESVEWVEGPSEHEVSHG